MMVQLLISNSYLKIVYNNININSNELNMARSKLFTKIVNNGHCFITSDDLSIVLNNFDVVTTSERQCLYNIYKYYHEDNQFNLLLLESLDKFVRYIYEVNDNDIKDMIIGSFKKMAIENNDFYIHYFNAELINSLFLCLSRVQQRMNLSRSITSMLLLLSSNSIFSLFLLF